MVTYGVLCAEFPNPLVLLTMARLWKHANAISSFSWFGHSCFTHKFCKSPVSQFTGFVNLFYFYVNANTIDLIFVCFFSKKIVVLSSRAEATMGATNCSALV
jgi:hypothetical protein